MFSKVKMKDSSLRFSKAAIYGSQQKSLLLKSKNA